MQIKQYLESYVCSRLSRLLYPDEEAPVIAVAPSHACNRCTFNRREAKMSKLGEPIFGVTMCAAGAQLYTKAFRAYGATTHAVELRVHKERFDQCFYISEKEKEAQYANAN